MNTSNTLRSLAMACVAVLASTEAAATARLGGTISLQGGYLGSCNVRSLVPTDTAQDSFALAAATLPCLGDSSSVQIRGEAATASIGLRAVSIGDGLGSSKAAAGVSFVDEWRIGVPAGTPIGLISLPVSLRLDGNISPGALWAFNQNRYLEYSLSIGDFAGNGGVGRAFMVNGRLAASGNFSQTFQGNVAFSNLGAGAPPTAQVSLLLLVPGLIEGQIDFYNTASASVTLPPGYTATTSSGLQLVFAPVPEPATTALMLLGGVALLCMARHRAAGRQPH